MRIRTRWQTVTWSGLLLLGGFYVFGATNDLVADARSGIPTDHTGTFDAVAGTGWATTRHTTPGTAAYITLLERGYAVHELVFAILFLITLAIPYRRGQRWAWFACWTPTVANLGYALTFGVHDPAIRYRSLVALIALPALLLAHLTAFFGRRSVGAPRGGWRVSRPR
jgi:hypothetical protein